MTSPTMSVSSPDLTITPDAFTVAEGVPRWPEMVPCNGQPLTLAEVVEHEAMGYRAWGTPTGDFLSSQMERLAQLLRWTDAKTPQAHEDRMQVWEQEIREQWFERGYHEGFEAGRRDGARLSRSEEY